MKFELPGREDASGRLESKGYTQSDASLQQRHSSTVARPRKD